MSVIEKIITDNLDVWSSAVKAKSAAGRGTSKKLELYGIKKLRELILELAVRGLLVPQDASDEPASELLKRIAAEKTKLVKEGKIKKQKALPAIREDEKPFELPVGWEWVRLCEVASVIRGITYKKEEVSDIALKNTIPLMRANNIDQILNFDNLLNVPETIVKSEQLIINGDLLIAMSSGSANLVGKAAQANEDLGCTFGAFCGVIRAFSSFLFPYFGFFFKTPLYRNQTQEIGKGIGIQNLNQGALSSLLIPIPTTLAMIQVVAKVDVLMALCDQLEHHTEASISAHQTLVQTLLGALTSASERDCFNEAWTRIAEHFDTLFTTEWSIDQLKQTILQLAVMGKLVPQDPNDEPASELLKKIAAEKARLIKEGKVKKQKPLPPIGEDEKAFDLPEGWEITRLDSLLPEFQNGASSRGDNHGREIVVIRLADISNWRVSLDQPRHLMIAESSISKYSLEENDVLIIRVNGSADIVGRFVFCEKTFDAIYCDHFIRMRFPLTVFSPEYLSLLGSSKLVRNRIEDMFVSTAGQKTVNQKHIGSLVLTLPPLEEQRRIVAKVDVLMAICDTLKNHINTAKNTQLHLADAMAEKAVA